MANKATTAITHSGADWVKCKTSAITAAIPDSANGHQVLFGLCGACDLACAELATGALLSDVCGSACIPNDSTAASIRKVSGSSCQTPSVRFIMLNSSFRMPLIRAGLPSIIVCSEGQHICPIKKLLKRAVSPTPT